MLSSQVSASGHCFALHSMRQTKPPLTFFCMCTGTLFLLAADAGEEKAPAASASDTPFLLLADLGTPA